MSNETPGANESSATTTVEQALNEAADSNPLKPVVQALLGELANYRETNEKDKARLKRRVTRIEDGATESSESEPTDRDGETGSDGDDLLPIERLARLKDTDDDPENPFAETTASVDRAVSIYQHFREWSSKAPSGRVIRDNLKNLLGTATGERLHWKQVYRACRELAEWSRGTITFKKTRRHGWILVADERASSVG